MTTSSRPSRLLLAALTVAIAALGVWFVRRAPSAPVSSGPAASERSAATAPPARFADVTAEAGLGGFLRVNGATGEKLLPETTGENAVKACERLRQTVAEHRFEYDGKHIPVTVSIGVAVNGPDADTPERLLRSADTKLYQAKAAGRNKVVC